MSDPGWTEELDLTRCLEEQAQALERADWTAPPGSDAWRAALWYEDWLAEECALRRGMT